MKISDALAILGLAKIANQEQIKLAFRKASSKYHPDRNPAGLEMMKSVNVAYATLTDSNYDGSENPIEGEVNQSFGDELMAAINAVIHLDGIIIEVCGSWVWLSGETKQHKDAIKEAGYFWASKKFKWYFKPQDYKCKSHGTWDMDKIRTEYGSSEISRKESKKISG